MPVPDSAVRQGPTIAGRAPRSDAGASAWIRAKENERRLLAVSDTSWEAATVGGRAVLLPVLIPLDLKPGANGVTTRDANQPAEHSVRGASRIAEDRGFQVLPLTLKIAAEHLPPGVEPGPYIREYDCREHRDAPLKLHYREAWDVPVATPAGEWQAFRYHRESYDRWRLHLVESGAIRPPSPLVAERLRTTAEARVARVEGAAYPDPRVHDRKVREAAERLALTADAGRAAEAA